ncbi:hypothetical protein CFC35_32045 [Streptomyces sp. FBKL.4005]|nr:hypothetical protein CFC35_32045 [Streptomyces sp. FBKL.4005]
MHDERLLGLLDSGLTGVPTEARTTVLPLPARLFLPPASGTRPSHDPRGPSPTPARLSFPDARGSSSHRPPGPVLP